MSYAALLRHSLVIEVPAGRTADEWGNTDPNPYPYTDGATIRGRIEEIGAQKVEGPDLGGTVIIDTLIFLEADAGVTERNRLRDATSGARYEVLFVRDAGGQGHHLEVDARRLKP